MQVIVTGATEGAKIINDIINNIEVAVLAGMEEAAGDIEYQIIQEAARAGEVKYAESVVIRRYPSENKIVIGPTAEWAEIQEEGLSAAVYTDECAREHYPEASSRGREERIAILHNVAGNNLERMRNIIVNKVRTLVK